MFIVMHLSHLSWFYNVLWSQRYDNDDAAGHFYASVHVGRGQNNATFFFSVALLNRAWQSTQRYFYRIFLQYIFEHSENLYL